MIMPSTTEAQNQKEIFLLSYIKNQFKSSPTCIRTRFLHDLNIDALLRKSKEKFSQKFDIEFDEQAVRLYPQECELDIADIKGGLISVVVKDFDFAFYCIINTHLKKVLFSGLITSEDLTDAYYERYKNDPDPLVKTIEKFSNPEEFLERSAPRYFSLCSVYFDSSSRSALVYLGIDLIVKVNLRVEGIHSNKKYEFFAIPKTNFRRSLSQIVAIKALRSDERRLPAFWALDVREWYYVLNGEIDVVDDEDDDVLGPRLKFWPYISNFYDLTPPDSKDKHLQTLIFNNQEAVILRGDERIPVVKFSFRFYIYKKRRSDKFQLEKLQFVNENEEEKQENDLNSILFYRNAFSTLTLLRVDSDDKGALYISKAKMINIGSTVRKPGERIEVYSERLCKTKFLKNRDGSISVISLCMLDSRNRMELTRLVLDGDSWKIRDAKAGRYSSVNIRAIQVLPFEDSYFLCLPPDHMNVSYGHIQTDGTKTSELQLLDSNLEVLDHFKIQFYHSLQKCHHFFEKRGWSLLRSTTPERLS